MTKCNFCGLQTRSCRCDVGEYPIAPAALELPTQEPTNEEMGALTKCELAVQGVFTLRELLDPTFWLQKAIKVGFAVARFLRDHRNAE